ncbi:hypothetical protein B0H14DRAFT_3854305 [Mycena olivaceomarginata]|nr:hypothetical protein B0H14DRAFT_3854305 [Mycena olivaceomarginata]
MPPTPSSSIRAPCGANPIFPGSHNHTRHHSYGPPPARRARPFLRGASALLLALRCVYIFAPHLFCMVRESSSSCVVRLEIAGDCYPRCDSHIASISLMCGSVIAFYRARWPTYDTFQSRTDRSLAKHACPARQPLDRNSSKSVRALRPTPLEACSVQQAPCRLRYSVLRWNDLRTSPSTIRSLSSHPTHAHTPSACQESRGRERALATTFSNTAVRTAESCPLWAPVTPSLPPSRTPWFSSILPYSLAPPSPLPACAARATVGPHGLRRFHSLLARHVHLQQVSLSPTMGAPGASITRHARPPAGEAPAAAAPYRPCRSYNLPARCHCVPASLCSTRSQLLSGTGSTIRSTTEVRTKRPSSVPTPATARNLDLQPTTSTIPRSSVRSTRCSCPPHRPYPLRSPRPSSAPFRPSRLRRSLPIASAGCVCCDDTAAGEQRTNDTEAMRSPAPPPAPGSRYLRPRDDGPVQGASGREAALYAAPGDFGSHGRPCYWNVRDTSPPFRGPRLTASTAERRDIA